MLCVMFGVNVVCCSQFKCLVVFSVSLVQLVTDLVS